MFSYTAWSNFEQRSRWIGVCMVLLSTLSGCALPSATSNTGSQGADRVGLTCATTGECAPVPANSAFGSLVAAAVYNSPEVASVRADLRRAQAELKVAQGGRYPTIGIESEADGSNEVARVTVRQPIWRGGRILSAVQRAEANVQAASAKLIIAQVEAAGAFIDAFAAQIQANYTVEALENSLREHRSILELVDRRLEQGLSADSEGSLVAARLASTEAEKFSAEAASEIAKAKLTSQLGREISDTEIATAATLPVGEIAFTDVALANAVDASPYVALTAAEIEKAKAAISVAKAEKLPDLTINASDGITDILSGGASAATRVFVGVASTVGPGRSLRNQIAVAEAELDALVAIQEARKRSVRNEIEAQRMQFTAAQGRVESTAVVVKASEAVLESYRTVLSSSGGKGWQDLLAAARELSESRRSSAVSRSEHFASYWKLRLAVFGLMGL